MDAGIANSQRRCNQQLGDASMNMAGFMAPRWLKSLGTGLRVDSGSHGGLRGKWNCSSARDLGFCFGPRTSKVLELDEG